MAWTLSGLFPLPKFDRPRYFFNPLDPYALLTRCLISFNFNYRSQPRLPSECTFPLNTTFRMQLNGWPKALCPFACVASWSDHLSDEKVRPEDQQSLASSLQGSLNILILYYLSTRKTLNDTLPTWLFIYGILYDECGAKIFAHYPRLVEIPGQEPFWGYGSAMVTNNQGSVFTTISGDYSFAQALLRIQGHTLRLMGKLEAWDTSANIQPLIQYARHVENECTSSEVQCPVVDTSRIFQLKSDPLQLHGPQNRCFPPHN